MQRHLIIKITIIAILALLILIPVSMVKYKVYERQGYLNQARASVAKSWTGEQLIVTPVLVIPYQISTMASKVFYTDKGQSVVNNKISKREKIVLPDQLTNRITVDNKTVSKGIYKVPVYDSQVELTGAFSAKKLQQALANINNTPGIENLGTPYLAVHISDMRGVDKAPELTINTATIALVPGSQLTSLPEGFHGFLSDSTALEAKQTFKIKLSLRGMGSFSFLPLADDASNQMASNWPHPEFIGASLPKDRTISAQGFTASWSSSRYSSNAESLLSKCLANDTTCYELTNASSGVSFIEPVDIYLQSERSIKYAMLFIGLSFITFFIVEHITNLRIHPIQYAFVGLAISVFYLLLISLVEHISFGWAYLIGVICCCSLLIFYVRYMLHSLRSSLLFGLMIAGLYGLLYVIVQAEDFALLMGSILVFAVLAALMVATRHIDWYKLAPSDKPIEQ
ncbi:cell envelope integrity protein CreD [Aestuariirhabdus sp. Z084]|uniref:cell envelope integrity protein CreD n=1 Tax=Aestuariirhabdus haliotis TaxID=2918751 RepID=UPI00201B3D9B|nr:cell envelope integrity protein CreD [Aestuariirhabdus haliotis]MCL6416595.1 cell envelope integrity protein CreD [Aestuariirhabdus haliotis]MCL6420630.1 cell envelope integrity protein CreD [Aestuariirhabdus haliotis]